MLDVSTSSWRWLARTGLFFALVVISTLAFSSNPPELTIQLGDKFNHALAFFVLAALLDQAGSRLQLLPGIVLPLLGYGLFIEVVQGQLGYREMSLLDVVADGGGLVLYAVTRARVQRGIMRCVTLR